MLPAASDSNDILSTHSWTCESVNASSLCHGKITGIFHLNSKNKAYMLHQSLPVQLPTEIRSLRKRPLVCQHLLHELMCELNLPFYVCCSITREKKKYRDRSYRRSCHICLPEFHPSPSFESL